MKTLLRTGDGLGHGAWMGAGDTNGGDMDGLNR